jgi:hypothetical protein
MKFTQTDYKQFVDEIFFLNRDKDFAGTFIDTLKGTVTIKDVDSILEEKRKGYNFALTNLFRKYNIVPDDLYSSLDRVWHETALNDVIASYLEKVSPKTIGFAFPLPTLLGGLAVAHLSIYQYAVRSKWEGYKASALLFADEHAKGLVKNE